MPIACKKLFFKKIPPADAPLPPEKDDHQFFIFMWPNLQMESSFKCPALHQSEE